MNSYEITELARKLSNIIMPGVVHSADYVNARLRVKSGELITVWLPWLTTRAGSDKAWWAPEVGEQVLLLCPDGNPVQGWVLPAGFTETYPQPEASPDVSLVSFNDGAVVRYNRTTHTLDVTLPDDATVNIISSGGVNITGDLTVTGNITSTADITDKTRSMAADRDIYNGHTHPKKNTPPDQKQ